MEKKIEQRIAELKELEQKIIRDLHGCQVAIGELQNIIKPKESETNKKEK